MKPDGWDVRAVAPSGRWVLLTGNEQSEDYIHFDALLLDTGKHELFPLRAGRWPRPLSAAQRGELERIGDKTTGIVGESDVRFLEGDILVMDELVVVPEQRIFKIGGDVAR